MAFVNERISDEDRKKYDPNNQFLGRSLEWSIDRDTETFLASNGMARMEPEDETMYIGYILFWENEFIGFHGEYYFRESSSTKDKMKIRSLKLFNSSKIDKNKLFHAIKEAIQAYGTTGEAGLENTTNYSFDFSEVL